MCLYCKEKRYYTLVVFVLLLMFFAILLLPRLLFGGWLVGVASVHLWLHWDEMKKTKVQKYYPLSVQKIPNMAYQIYQRLQIYLVYEKHYIKYKYDRKWKTENMAEKHTFHE